MSKPTYQMRPFGMFEYLGTMAMIGLAIAAALVMTIEGVASLKQHSAPAIQMKETSTHYWDGDRRAWYTTDQQEGNRQYFANGYYGHESAMP